MTHYINFDHYVFERLSCYLSHYFVIIFIVRLNYLTESI